MTFLEYAFSFSIFGQRVALVLVVGWAFALIGPVHAQHPTAVTSIVNSAQDTTLEVNYNGSVLMTGTFLPRGVPAPDSIPAEGVGTRLLWFPSNAAFRAGRVEGSQWNGPNIGLRSTAFGFNTEATASDATAMCDETTASGFDATAMGRLTTASGDRATAMGKSTNARGDASTAMGRSTDATGERAVSMGGFTDAGTDQSLSIGECNNANSAADNTLFVAGNGTFDRSSGCTRSDALVLDRSGNLTLSGDVSANNVGSTSDRRLKTGIEPVRENVLEKLSRIQPVRYHLKNERTHSPRKQVGLIAQDVREEFPSLVRKGSDGYLSLFYPKLSAVLLKGLQVQQTELQRKSEKIDDLEAENEQIKERLAALEAKVSANNPALAGLTGPWGLALLLALGLGGLISSLVWRHRPDQSCS